MGNIGEMRRAVHDVNFDETIADTIAKKHDGVTQNSLIATAIAHIADTNDPHQITWAQVDKTVSSLADITTKSHTVLSNIGTNTHVQIDTHLASTSNPHSVTLAQVGGTTDHTALTNIGTNTHAQIDTHLADTDKHILHSGVSVIAGTGMSGGGTIEVSRTLNCTITQYTDEMVDDRVNALIQNGTGIAWTYDDILNTLTGNVSITQYTDELAQDAVGTILTDSSTIDFTYNDVANTITAAVIPGGISHTAITNIGTNAHSVIDTHLADTDKHVLHSGVSIIAGTGMSGGGTIAISRTLDCTITQYTDTLARAAISETVTGLTYTSATGVLSLTAGYVIPTTTQETNWGTAYTHSQIAGGNSVHVSTAENTNWDAAYGWGNHASAGYLTSVTAHNLLSTTHGDTTASACARGSVIVGDVNIKWVNLAFPVTPTGKVLIATATDVAWSTSALGTAAYTATTAYAPALGADDNYVTDAQLIVIGNTSGTNTGDASGHASLQPLDSVLTELTALTDPAANRVVWWNDTTNNFEFKDFANWDTAYTHSQGTGSPHTWAGINKTVSSIADITTRSHTALTDIGTNTHAQIDTHLALTNPHLDWTIDQGATNIHAGNYTDTNTTDHTLLTNIGTNTHAQIDTAIANSVAHIADNTQAHSDYLLNTGDTATGDYTFDTSTLFIDSTSHRVGIGTTTPDTKLDVIDDSINAGFRVRHSNLTQGISIGYNTIIANGANANQNVNITSKGTGYILLNNGNVGIGTTAPTNILSLGNSAARKFWIENTATDVVGRALTVAAGSTVAGTAVSNVVGGNLILQAGLGTGTGTSTISFQTGTTLTTGTTLQTMSTKMTILGNGNVGIGTMTPSEKLYIEGGNLTLKNIVGGANLARIKFYGQTGDANNQDSGGVQFVNDNSPYYSEIAGFRGVGSTYAGLNFKTANNAAPGTVMTILPSGNVGIGMTTDLTQKLNVNGILRSIRGTGATNTYYPIYRAEAITTGIMADGLGTGYAVYLQDSDGVNNNIASFGAIRDGADNSGKIIFNTVNAGTETTKMVIDKTGNAGIGTTATTNARLNVQSTGTTDILKLFETGGVEVFTVMESGKVGIGSASPRSMLKVVGLPLYQSNEAALAGDLAAGDFYRVGANPDTVCVVH